MQLPTVLFSLCLITAGALTATSNAEPIQLFQQTLNTLVERVEKLEETVNKQSATIDDQKELIQRLTEGVKGSDGAAPLVAFTAYLDKIITNPPVDTPIPFNRVLLNEGNGYNISSGKFTSPQAGVYLFTFGLESDAPHFLVASLIVDGVNQVNSVCIQYQNGGNTAMVRLNSGSSVWIGTSGVNATIWNSDKLHYSTFSGILLN